MIKLIGVAALGTILALCCVTTPAYAWGDEGHEIVGLIAQHYLTPAVTAKVNAILATDNTGLVPQRTIDFESTWADKYRGASKANSDQTFYWHFVDLEIDAPPDVMGACFGEPPLNGALAFNGPPKDC